MTLDELIEALRDIRTRTRGDVPVAILDADTETWLLKLAKVERDIERDLVILSGNYGEVISE